MADPEQPEVRAELEREAAQTGEKLAKEKPEKKDAEKYDDGEVYEPD